jgi:hypothetical protein
VVLYFVCMYRVRAYGSTSYSTEFKCLLFTMIYVFPDTPHVTPCSLTNRWNYELTCLLWAWLC